MEFIEVYANKRVKFVTHFGIHILHLFLVRTAVHVAKVTQTDRHPQSTCSSGFSFEWRKTQHFTEIGIAAAISM